MSCINSIIDCICAAHEIQNGYLTHKLVFLAGVELKKNKPQLEEIELTHLI